MAAGYAVELAESPKRAREVIENEAVALAILALQRSGAAGQELARELRGAIGRLIIVIEPPADAGRQTAEAIESDGSISKPLNEAETLETVKAALPAPPKEAEPLPETLFCRLYAVGADVVWSITSLPLPLPFDIHDEPLEEAFDAAALLPNMTGQTGYMNRANHRALALQGTPQGMGGFYAAFGTALRPTAVRLAIEGCVDIYLSPCLLVSVDGLWTIRVPKSRRIVGLFMLTNEAAISGEDKQRIGAVYQQNDWRAMARGKAGGWYPVAGAPSESAAIEQALERCAEHDSECHIHAISNFRVADEG